MMSPNRFSSSFFRCVANIILLFLVTLCETECMELDDEPLVPISISFKPPADKVYLNEQLKIRCQLSANNKEKSGRKGDRESDLVLSELSMFLYCPITPTKNFCFQNCKSICTGQEESKCPYFNDLDSVQCTQTSTHDGRVTFEYTLPKVTSKWLGDVSTSTSDQTYNEGFYCKLALQNTPLVKLKIAPKTTTTTITTTTVVIANKTVAPKEPEVIIPPSKSSQPDNPIEVVTPEPTSDGNEGLDRPQIEFSDQMKFEAALQEVIFIGVIIIVVTSILLNAFCFIRCALIRHYSKSKGPIRMQHSFCMAEEIANARLVKEYRPRSNCGTDKTHVPLIDGKISLNGSVNGDSNRLYSNHVQLTDFAGIPNYAAAHLGNQLCYAAVKPERSDVNSNCSLDTRHLIDGQRVLSHPGSAFTVYPSQYHVLQPTNGRQSVNNSLIISPPPSNFQAPDNASVSKLSQNDQLISKQNDPCKTDGSEGRDGSFIGSVSNHDRSVVGESSQLSTFENNNYPNGYSSVYIRPVVPNITGSKAVYNQVQPVILTNGPSVLSEHLVYPNSIVPMDAHRHDDIYAGHRLFMMMDRGQPMGASQPQMSAAQFFKSGSHNAPVTSSPNNYNSGTAVTAPDGSHGAISVSRSGQTMTESQTQLSNETVPLSVTPVNGLKDVNSDLNLRSFPRKQHRRHRQYRSYRGRHRPTRITSDHTTEDEISDWSDVPSVGGRRKQMVHHQEHFRPYGSNNDLQKILAPLDQFHNPTTASKYFVRAN